MSQKNYGRITAPLIGIAMKEMVRRAIEAIRAQRFVFEAKAKEGYDGEMNDLVTTADRAAQAVYVKLMQEAFPGYGIVAEEEGLRIDCNDPELGDAYFTVDPLDGTKAFGRRQSHGIGTMVALVQNGEVIAAYIGDVMTEEIYGYRPESRKVHRISEYGHAEQLTGHIGKELNKLQLLVRKPREKHSPLSQAVMAMPEDGGPFKEYESATGSIGISMARLWKGEVGAAIIDAKHVTPWDATPVIGISEQLGFVFMEPSADGQRFVRKPTALSKEVRHDGRDELVIHANHLPAFEAWQDSRR